MNSSLTYTLDNEFEELYVSMCLKEGRVYTNDEVKLLPEISKTHRYSSEWAIKKSSLKRLTSYLKHKGNEFNLLDVGCGNGWLSAQLAKHTSGKVIGVDINGMAIEQAKEIFHEMNNIAFVQANLNDGILGEEKFDIIVFADAIQYFSSLKNIIAIASKYLTLQGEIHIIDSNFYKQKEIAVVKQITSNHFRDAGFETLTLFYFHHSIEDLKKFNYHILYNPVAWNNKLMPNHNPFYHVIIKNRYQ